VGERAAAVLKALGPEAAARKEGRGGEACVGDLAGVAIESGYSHNGGGAGSMGKSAMRTARGPTRRAAATPRRGEREGGWSLPHITSGV
jgi:DNA-binding transcriptional ArsR family regulator